MYATKNEEPILRLLNVEVRFGKEEVLKNVNLTIRTGETVVIIGPSGSGKSVLLKTMAGIIKPTSGRVFCEGEDWQLLQAQGKHELAREIGVQFQKSALFDELSVFDNVAFPLHEHRPNMTPQEIESRVKECLEEVDLWDSRNLMPFEISGGMQLRLGFARAIVLKPKIMFYDDPTAGLDPINSDNVIQLIMKLKQQYKSTLIVATHSIDLAYELAGRIMLVTNKNVFETGGAEQTRHHRDPRVQQFIHGQLSGPLNWA